MEPHLSKLALKARVSKEKAVASAKEVLVSQKAIQASDSVKISQSKKMILSSRLSQDHRSHLAWYVEILEGINHWQVFLDAISGESLFHYNATCSAIGKGMGHYSSGKLVPLITQKIQSKLFNLEDAFHQYGTYDAANQVAEDSSDLDEFTENLESIISIFSDTNNLWTDEYQYSAVDAHYHAKWTYQYYANTFQWYGVDGNDEVPIKTVVHYGEAMNNAFWIPSGYVVFGDGDGEYYQSLTSLDIVAHELTHGVDEYTSQLVYAKESGGLDESWSDIFGVAAEFYAADRGYGEADWMLGEDPTLPDYPYGEATRYMDDPTKSYQIDHYSNYYDGLDVHVSSGISNNAFYLISEGGTNSTSGLTVATGIGISKAEQIFFRARKFYMAPESTFLEAAYATIWSASDLYGEESQEVKTVREGWRAVGVSADFSIDSRYHLYGQDTIVIEPNKEAVLNATFEWPFSSPGSVEWSVNVLSSEVHVDWSIHPINVEASERGEMTQAEILLNVATEHTDPVDIEIVETFSLEGGSSSSLSKTYHLCVDDHTTYGTSTDVGQSIFRGSDFYIYGINLDEVDQVVFSDSVSASFTLEYLEDPTYPVLHVWVPDLAVDGLIYLDNVSLDEGMTYYIVDSIQEAIDKAASGDTIIVPPGDYYEKLTITWKSLYLISKEGASQTRIISTDSRTISVDGETTFLGQPITEAFTLEGFTILNQYSGSTPKCLYIEGIQTVILKNNIIQAEWNSQDYAGYGIMVSYIQDFSMIGNTFECNIGAFLYANVTNADIQNNIAVFGTAVDTSGYSGYDYYTAIVVSLKNYSDQYGENQCNFINNTISIYKTQKNAQIGMSLTWYDGQTVEANLINNILEGDMDEGLFVDTPTESDLLNVLNNDVYGALTLYSGVSDPTGVDGNLSQDPLLDERGHLTSGLPCVDAGLDTSTYGMTTDIDGDNRPIDGNGDGTSLYDIGGDEYLLP
ncbi:MAG: M4 family metallopeptidase [Chlamydiae bacterium]|nr:M4 family metallopeptidase [Chlamydiota bacterium]MBI3278085.1 M4 family metallopeptidase [Chlamydiota bacterium]